MTKVSKASIGESPDSISAQVELWTYVAQVRPDIERALLSYLPLANARLDTKFNEALHYALFPGGKRLRPVLTLLGAEIVGGCATDVLAAAVAVEYVHTSSLIFDDLPCMDNASERRGQSSLHARYGEGLAVLVALALMNASYGLVFEHATPEKAARAINAHKELVECIGARGMVAGQSVDLAEAFAPPFGSGDTAPQSSGDNNFAVDTYDAVRNLKTSALMRLALRVGAILSGATPEQLAALSRFAELLGDAYQTRDDVLDLQEDAALSTGSTAGRRATFALERGAQDAGRRVVRLVAEAKDVLASEFASSSPSVRLLCQMADYIATRHA
ncbi:MAG: polyprenyl synthetase family protein [Pyrinomonadaceae bacterium]